MTRRHFKAPYLRSVLRMPRNARDGSLLQRVKSAIVTNPQKAPGYKSAPGELDRPRMGMPQSQLSPKQLQRHEQKNLSVQYYWL
jgi:hypothetical protein